MTTRTDILTDAANAVNGDRDTEYGTPADNLGRTAAMWSAYLGRRVSAADVAAMMIIVKVSRLAHTPEHHDSWVDLAGYAACGGEVV